MVTVFCIDISFDILSASESCGLCVQARFSIVIMDNPLTEDDIEAMRQQLRDCVEEDRKYWRVNNVKCDAITTAKSYEEFADRVAAAHLRPLEKSDFKNKNQRGWNQYAAKDKKNDE